MKSKQELATEKEALKGQHGRVYEINVPMDEDDETKTATIFLKKPDKSVRSMVEKVADKDGLKAVEATIKSLYIGGDTLAEVLAYEDAVPSCAEAIIELLTVKKATLKKN